MTLAALAHLALLGRHRRTTIIGGLHWRYCAHRSHQLRIPCWRWHAYDGYCPTHNNTCWAECSP